MIIIILVAIISFIIIFLFSLSIEPDDQCIECGKQYYHWDEDHSECQNPRCKMYGRNL